MLTTTAPSLAYNYVLEHTKPGQIELITDNFIDDWVRQAISGGRCFVQKSIFSSKTLIVDESFIGASGSKTLEPKVPVNNWNPLDSKEIDGNEDYLVDIDITSLYPAAMNKFLYPTGKPHWEQDLEKIRMQLNEQTMTILGIIECVIDFPNKDIVTPLLANRNCIPLMYTLKDNQYHIKTTIDILEAVKYNGAIVREVYRALVWSSSDYIFRDSIQVLWDLRKKAKQENNRALDIAIKTICNSSYGKTIQKKVESKLVVLDNNDIIDELYLKGRIVGDYTLPNQEQCLIEKKISNFEKAIKHPSHLGVFILAYSKVIMNDLIFHMHGFDHWDNAFYYTDTDSLIIHASLLKMIPSELLYIKNKT